MRRCAVCDYEYDDAYDACPSCARSKASGGFAFTPSLGAVIGGSLLAGAAYFAPIYHGGTFAVLTQTRFYGSTPPAVWNYGIALIVAAVATLGLSLTASAVKGANVAFGWARLAALVGLAYSTWLLVASAAFDGIADVNLGTYMAVTGFLIALFGVSALAPQVAHKRELIITVLIAAMMCASALVRIPIGAVPVTLQMFFVVLGALLLGPGWAAASMMLYIALGAAGLPVFSGGSGISALSGPTGGYLIGFAVGAVAGSALHKMLVRRHLNQLVASSAAAAAVLVAVYAIGTAQLAIVVGLDAGQAVAVGVGPFILIDAAKAVVAVVIVALAQLTRIQEKQFA